MKQKLLALTIIMVSLIFSIGLFATNNTTGATKQLGQSCNINSDCGGIDGAECAKSSDGTSKCLLKAGRSCGGDQYCQSGNCHSNICWGAKQNGEKCSFDADCGPSLKCANNVCTVSETQSALAKARICNSDSDCKAGQKCRTLDAGFSLLSGQSFNKTKVCLTTIETGTTSEDCFKDSDCSLKDSLRAKGCVGDACKCVKVQKVGSSVISLRKCVLAGELGEGAPCTTVNSNNDLHSTQCPAGYFCNENTKRCAVKKNTANRQEPCTTSSQCKPPLVCRKAVTGLDTADLSASSGKLTAGDVACLPALSKGSSCTNDSECGGSQKCIQTYSKEFIGTGGTPKYVEKTSDNKFDCGPEEIKEVNPSNAKEFRCKSKTKQCSDPTNPETQSSTSAPGTNVGLSKSCDLEVSKGLLTTKVSNQCINCGQCTLCDIVNTGIGIAQGIYGIAAPLAALMFFFGTIQYGGKSGEAKEKGKKAMTSAIVGLVIMLVAWVFVDGVIRFGLEATNSGSWYNPNYTCPIDAWKLPAGTKFIGT